jgi:WD40 repeat protein
MNNYRYYHTASILADGTVLAAGGYDGENILNTVESYNPLTGLWTYVGGMTHTRAYHTASMLANGQVLVAGGSINNNNNVYLSSCELYQP